VDRASGNNNVAPISVGQARRDLEDHERDLEAVKAGVARCDAALGDAINKLDMMQGRFERTRSALLQAEARAALLKWYDAQCRRLAAAAAFMEKFDSAGGDLPQGWAHHRHAPAGDPGIERSEKALIALLAALETDADAPVSDLIESLG
jgi:hypothetical protein